MGVVLHKAEPAGRFCVTIESHNEAFYLSASDTTEISLLNAVNGLSYSKLTSRKARVFALLWYRMIWRNSLVARKGGLDRI